MRFVVPVFEFRINFAEPDLGAGLDDESLAVVRRFAGPPMAWLLMACKD
jgi:hypothetical protein